MRSVRPRLSSLELYASTLLVSLGVTPLVGCGSEVIVTDDGGGGGAGAGNTGGEGTGNGSSNGGSGAGGAPGARCENPVPILVDGKDTGFDQCDGGQLARRAALECPASWPDENTCCGGCPDGQLCSDAGEVACQCVDACFTDADCAPGSICLCGDPAGVCIASSCTDASDCGTGQECTSWDPTLGCLYLEFACTTPIDQCGGDADCPPEASFCAVALDGHRECVPGGCAIGRPFLVDDVARVAPLARRSDWRDATFKPLPVPPELSDEIAAAWEATAQMEHASIAAFARFTLELLALGAPPELIERTNRALADETKHARTAFAMASAYRGASVGPGRLAIERALDDAADVSTFVRQLIREGCVGETVAAVEAAEAEDHAQDFVVREALGVIADDENEHAELAWRTLTWAQGAFPEAQLALEAELALLERELSVPLPNVVARDAALLAHGVVSPQLRAQLRRDTLRDAVLPCLRSIAAAGQRVAA